MRVLKGVLEFDWDTGNKGKNKKHGVEDGESEEAFFDEKKVILKDVLHSAREPRFILLGRTKKNRLLFIVFTMRGKKLRMISARDVSRKEKYLYEKEA